MLTRQEFDKLGIFLKNKAYEIILETNPSMQKSWYGPWYHDLENHRLLDEFVFRYKEMELLYGPAPHDLLGKQIVVGSRVAVALTFDRSSNLMVGYVTRIDDKGIQVEGETRSYAGGGMVGKKQTYKFPNRMVVLPEVK